MELLKLLWVIVFFFLALIILFTWSKLAIISKKALIIRTLVEQIDALYLDTEGFENLEDEL